MVGNSQGFARRVSGGVTTGFGYDDVGQILSESDSGGYSAAYTYDANGNRLTKTTGGVTQTYATDSGDKLTGITYSDSTPAKNFSYHFSGRCTGFTQGAITRAYSWDKECRITGVSETGQTSVGYGYNGFDARATRTFGGATTTFKRDGADPVDAVLSDISPGTTARYLPGISEQRNGVSTYFHDGIKNAITQTNASQSVTATKRYDAFGLQVASTGTWKSPFAYGGPWGYQEDGDAYGLKLLGHRYYDPSLGRFLSRDIAKSGGNWHAYCASDPVSFTDSSGLCVETVLDIIGVGMSLYDFVRDPSWENAGWLAADVAGAAIPFVPGTRFARKAAEGAEEAVDLAEDLGRHGDDILEAASKAAREGSPGAHCFTAGTLVEMMDGMMKPVEDVGVGDKVRSANQETGKTGVKTVSRTFASNVTVLTTIVLSDGAHFTSTVDHPYFVDGKGWTAASQLRPFDRIASERGEAIVQQTWTREELAKVYNLEVADTHTYLIGREGILVHNLCAWRAGGGDGGGGWRGGPRPPRDGSGAFLPDPAAGGRPHTRIFPDKKGKYMQGATFGEGGRLEGRVDVTDHGWPSQHPNPHFHPWNGPNGGWGRAEGIPWLR